MSVIDKKENRILNQINSHAPEVNENLLDVRGFYSGKNVFLSGCTGFVGKVLLEKLFRSCPDVNKLYIMVRPKRNKEPIDRVKNEILNSFNFSVVKKMHKDFFAWAESKIIPIVGDLVLDKLGISDHDR